jgi:predicted MFS family arabinose efflux permease
MHHISISQTRRTIGVMAMSQAFSMTGAGIVMLITGLAGAYLADDDRLATLPLAIQFLFTMAAAFPAALWMKHVGRRVGFTAGQLIGIVGGTVSAFALMQNSFSMLLAGAALLGVHNAFWGYYRFAAAEASPPDYRERAISLVMAGGILSALAAPEIAKLTRELFAPVLFAGCYVAIAALCVCTTLMIQFAALPPPRRAGHSGARPARPLKEIAAQPTFIVAAISGMVGYGTMILVMSATPLSMADCGLTFDDAAFVIQWHALAMFGLSFFTGSLIKRFGVLRVISAGIVLNVGCTAVNLSGVDLANFWLGLVALGLGWNFMFIGGTTLLTECYQPEEQSRK